MDKLIKFLEDHQELLAAVPGLVEGLMGYIERVLAGRGETDAQKQAHIEALVSELRSIAADYRTNPPELPA